MASDYPGAIEGLAATHADIEDSVLAVQTELGVNPSGASATVVARLATLDTTVAGKANTGAAVTDAQIPATIARDTEVTAAVTSHEAAADPHPGYLLESSATATYLSIGPGDGLTEGATKAELDAAVLAGGGGAGLPANVLTKTAAYTALVGDLILADATAGAFSIALPTTPAVGSLVTVKKVDAGANAVTVVGTIDSLTNATITARYYGGIFEYVGASGWQVVAVPTSAPGPKGDTGDTGPAGATGATGPTGLAGADGAPGVDGTDGTGVPVGGTDGQVLTKASATDGDVVWETPAAGGGGGSSVPLAVAYHNPGTLYSFTHSGGATTGDVDATNLAATFTVPASGKVMVRMAASMAIAALSATAALVLRQGTTDVQTQRTGGLTGSTNSQVRGHAIFYVTGLTPGASVTYKMGVNRPDGSGNVIVYAGGNVGAAYVIVDAA